MTKPFKSVNWNKLEDKVDLATLEKLNSQVWLDTRIPVSNDIQDWNNLKESERVLYDKVLGGLTTLDTLQSEEGAIVVGQHTRTQHEKAVMNNIAYMECLSDKSKVLTHSGWKSVRDIVKGEEIMQYNPNDKSMSFTKVLNKSSHVPEEMYLIENRKFSIEVSGGHRMYVEEKVKKNIECKDWTYKTVNARDYANVPRTDSYRDRLIGDSFKSNNSNKLSNIDRLIIATQADGSFNKNRLYKDTINKIDIRFSLSKDSKINRLYNIVNSIDESNNIKIKEISRDKRSDTKRNFAVNLNKSQLKNFKEDKNFYDFFNIEYFNQDMAIDFINELSHWDSHIHKDSKGEETIIYYTSNKKNADFVMAISAIACKPFTYSVRKDNRKETYKDSHIVSIRSKENSKFYTSQSNKTIKEIEPKEVFGIEVESTFFPVLTDRGIVITGNCIHAKSYSTIFSTLRTPTQIDDIFSWTEENEYLQYKAKRIQEVYRFGNELQKRVASVFLESFLFYSGFYTPLYYVGMGKMSNVAEIIKLIIRDESVHGTYIGYKHMLGFNELSESQREAHEDWTYQLLDDLFQNEIKYTQELYDELGYTEDVKQFLRYNADKALMNLGFDTIFEVGRDDVNPIVMNGISTETSNHDFFSAVGNGYLLGVVEAMQDSDYDMIKNKINK